MIDSRQCKRCVYNTYKDREAIIMFKKRRGIHIPYNKQGLIYFICINIKDMPEDVQRKILNLCIDVSGEHYRALYAMITDDTKNIHEIAMKFHISETQLYYYRKKFYESWKSP